MAQTGLTYCKDPYDIERYQRLRRLAAEMMAERPEEVDPIERELLKDLGHATPKVDVRSVVIQGKDILLVKERADGKWTLPGGWADIGESPRDSVVRETREESGFEVEATKLLALWDRRKQGHPPHPAHIYKIFFRCRIVGGAASPSLETESVDFFPEGALPELSLGRVTPAQIARFFEHERHPDLPTDFE